MVTIPILAWKVRSEPLGKVVDYCEFCRAITSFTIFKQTQETIVFIVPVEDSALGHVIHCDECQLAFSGAATNYQSIVTDAVTPDELLQRTNPDVAEKYAPQLEREKTARDGTLPQSGREEILLRTIQTISYMIQPETF